MNAEYQHRNSGVRHDLGSCLAEAPDVINTVGSQSPSLLNPQPKKHSHSPIMGKPYNSLQAVTLAMLFLARINVMSYFCWFE